MNTEEVLLNTSVEFQPNIIAERYPVELQNLYKGNQLMLFGPYTEAAPLSITFRGNAYSNDVEYQYDLSLSDSKNHKYQFLLKLWAKVKIDELLSQYYQNIHQQEMAESIKEEIIALSINYGVISPFTSFIDGGNQFRMLFICPGPTERFPVNSFGQVVYVHKDFISGKGDYTMKLTWRTWNFPPASMFLCWNTRGKP